MATTQNFLDWSTFKGERPWKSSRQSDLEPQKEVAPDQGTEIDRDTETCKGEDKCVRDAGHVISLSSNSNELRMEYATISRACAVRLTDRKMIGKKIRDARNMP